MLAAFLFAVVSAILGGLAVPLQKMGMSRNGLDFGRLLKSPQWLLGWLLAGAAFVLYMAALSAGEIAMVQPVVASSVVIAAAAAPFLSKERIDRKTAVALAVVVAGLAILGASA